MVERVPVRRGGGRRARRPAPSSITSDGSGSFGPSIATRPSSASGSISTSRRSSRSSRAANRAERASGGKEALAPRRRRRASRTNAAVSGASELVEPLAPRPRAPPRSSGAGEAPCRSRGSSRPGAAPARPRAAGSRRAAARPAAAATSACRRSVSGVARSSAASTPLAVQRQLVEREPARRRDEIRPLAPERVVALRVEGHVETV